MNKKILPLVLVLLLILPLVLGISVFDNRQPGGERKPKEVLLENLNKYDIWKAKDGTEKARGRLVENFRRAREVESVYGKLGDITVNFKNGEKHIILGGTLDRDVSGNEYFGKPGTECGNGVCEPSENKNNCPDDCLDDTTTTTSTTTTSISSSTTTSQSSTTTLDKPYEGTAVIFDPFRWEGEVFENPELIYSVTEDLESEEYTVNYYQNDKVTLELVKTAMSTGVVYNRGHGGVAEDTGEVVIVLYETFNEKAYKEKYPDDWDNGRFYSCTIRDLNGYYHHKICYNPKFVDHYYSSLPNSLIYMESCEGLNNPSMANAFTSSGAATYVGWTQSVTVTGGDAAAEENFEDLTAWDQTVHKTVSETPEDGHGRWAAKLEYEGNGELGL